MQFADVAGFFSRIEETTSRLRMVELLAELLGGASAEEMDRLIYLSQGRVGPAWENVEFGVGEALAAATGACARRSNAATTSVPIWARSPQCSRLEEPKR